MEQMMDKESMNVEISETSMTAGKKEGKGMMIGMVMCSILALVGIGFGVYEYLQANQAKQQISDLKVEIKNSDGSTTTLETDKIEVKEDGKTVVISNPATMPTSTIRDIDNRYYLVSSARIFPNNSIEPEYSIIAVVHNGELSCGIYETKNGAPVFYNFEDGTPVPQKSQECNLAEHDGTVLDVVNGHMGNGADSTIFVLTTDGELEYFTYGVEDYGAIKKLELPHKVVRIWGDNRIHVGSLWAGNAVMIQYDNGDIADLSDFIKI